MSKVKVAFKPDGYKLQSWMQKELTNHSISYVVNGNIIELPNVTKIEEKDGRLFIWFGQLYLYVAVKAVDYKVL